MVVVLDLMPFSGFGFTLKRHVYYWQVMLKSDWSVFEDCHLLDVNDIVMKYDFYSYRCFRC